MEKTAAIVIRQADFSETSRVVTLFTHDFGRFSVLAKGAKRLKGPFEAAIDLLSTCHVVFIRKSTGSLGILTEAKLINRFRPAGSSMGSLYGGYYVAELLQGLTEDEDPHPVLFEEAVLALEQLSSTQQTHLVINAFELIILREIGQLPTFDECLVCSEPVAGGRSFAYWASQGGMICETCQRADIQSNQIQPGTLAIMRRLAFDGVSGTTRLVASVEQLREMRSMLTRAISHVLGRRPKMLQYIQVKT